MKLSLIALALCMPVLAQTDVSFVNEGIVNARVEEVWKLLSTAEGFKVLGPAQVQLDLRVGGLIRTRYGSGGSLGDDATIENRILAFEPPTMIAIQIHKPPKNFPFKEAWKNTWTVLTLKPIAGGRMVLRVASLGYGADSESEAMRKFFEAGNQHVIENVQRHFAPSMMKDAPTGRN